MAQRLNAQVRDAPEVPEVAGDEFQAVVQGGGRDLEIGCGEAPILILEIGGESTVDLGDGRIERQDRPTPAVTRMSGSASATLATVFEQREPSAVAARCVVAVGRSSAAVPPPPRQHRRRRRVAPPAVAAV